MEHRSRATSIFRNATLIVLCLIAIYPVLWVFKLSFGADAELDPSLSIWPKTPTLANFRDVLFDRPFFTWLWNSVVISVSTTVLGVFLATTSAYALSRFRFPLRTTSMLAFLVTGLERESRRLM